MKASSLPALVSVVPPKVAAPWKFERRGLDDRVAAVAGRAFVPAAHQRRARSGIAGAEILCPGDPSRSVLYYRVSKVGSDSYANRLASEARQFKVASSELRDGIDRILRIVQWLIIPVAALLITSQVLSHRDFHSWNILVRGDAPFVIDFQDALLAPPEYDLASLLTKPLDLLVLTTFIDEVWSFHHVVSPVQLLWPPMLGRFPVPQENPQYVPAYQYSWP